ncbi:uncharacterized protein [Leptinotarsa decemlineata]|uniref:uncharacterized protein n=1 Tax=Leptinotarsa decemlineata TaxID=7539 RepID=UPI003D3059CB
MFKMVFCGQFILLIVIELSVLVNFSRTSCITKNRIAYCSSVTKLSDNYFNESIKDYQDLIELHIANNHSKLSIGTSTFKNAVNLKVVYIEQSRIQRLLEGTFEGLELEMIIIDYNGIEKIDPGSFHNLRLLEILSLVGNRLKTIPKGVFKDLPRLSFLDLSMNEISLIDDLALENLPKLDNLRLDSNKLETFSVHKSVSYPGQLESLSLYNNSLSSVTEYMLQNLSRLKYLNFHMNKISVIEARAFEQTTQLKDLRLSYNNLREVDGTIFPRRGLHNLKRLDLDNNELMFLSSNFLFRLPFLEIISLHENPWKCACLSAIRTILVENGIKEKCEKIYSTGKIPSCVTKDFTNKMCSHNYDTELRNVFMTYKKTYGGIFIDFTDCTVTY